MTRNTNADKPAKRRETASKTLAFSFARCNQPRSLPAVGPGQVAQGEGRWRKRRPLNYAAGGVSNLSIEILARPSLTQDSACHHGSVVAGFQLFTANRASLKVSHHNLVVGQFPIAFRDGAGARFRGDLGLHHDPRLHTIPSFG